MPTLPSETNLTMPVNGMAYIIERVKLADLADWKKHHGLRPTGLVESSAGQWPPVIIYEETK